MTRLKRKRWARPDSRWKLPVGVPPPLPAGKFTHCDGQLSLADLWAEDPALSLPVTDSQGGDHP